MTELRRVAFVCPRYAVGPTVGGAETLLKNLAQRLAGRGIAVTFLTTCARDHVSWTNEWPAGRRTMDGLEVEFFPVDADRDVTTFLTVQDQMCRGRPVSAGEEEAWLRNSVQSRALLDRLAADRTSFDRIIAGPYLFGLIHAACRVNPRRTLLVPCLHDEPFAYLRVTRDLFRSVRGFLFNSGPERDLAERLHGPGIRERGAVVGMAVEPFEASPDAFARRRGLKGPYVIYSGRREPMKGTPLLLDYLNAFRQRHARVPLLVLTGSGPAPPPPGMDDGVLDVGFVPEAEKREAMAGAVAFCHPSIHESLGIVLLESWLARTPALVHAGSAVLRDQCRRSGGGLWFRTYPEFEVELELLLQSPTLRRRLGENGRRFVLEQYAPEAVDRRLLDALAQL